MHTLCNPHFIKIESMSITAGSYLMPFESQCPSSGPGGSHQFNFFHHLIRFACYDVRRLVVARGWEKKAWKLLVGRRFLSGLLSSPITANSCDSLAPVMVYTENGYPLYHSLGSTKEVCSHDLPEGSCCLSLAQLSQRWWNSHQSTAVYYSQHLSWEVLMGESIYSIW